MVKKIIIWGIVVLVALIAGFFSLNLYMYNEKQANELTQEQIEILVSGYIEENISHLSPEPEVLGGTFYVTNIEFGGMNAGVVEYEDGHIALVADFEYFVDGEEIVGVDLTNVREPQP